MERNRRCGYDACACSPNDVQFISRFQGESDYCVGGHRIHVFDDGTLRGDPSPREIEQLRCYFLREFVRYIEWRRDRRARWGADFAPDAPQYLFPYDTARRAALYCYRADRRID